jgi:hypothetical protein
MTISEIKLRMVHDVVGLCHELAHALEQQNCDTDCFRPPLVKRDRFLLHGLLSWRNHGIHVLQWPCQPYCDRYRKGGTSMPWVRFSDMGPERCIPIEPRQ